MTGFTLVSRCFIPASFRNKKFALELFLNPKNQEYGPDYQSGQIRVAFTQGNADESNKLYGGCILGTTPEARKYAMRVSNKEGSWCDDYHTYKLRWSNGS